MFSSPATLRVYSGELTVEFVEGSVLLKVEGLQGGSGYSIDVASELSAVGTVWESLVSVVDISGSFQFIDPEPSTAEGSRYYRLRMLP